MEILIAVIITVPPFTMAALAWVQARAANRAVNHNGSTKPNIYHVVESTNKMAATAAAKAHVTSKNLKDYTEVQDGRWELIQMQISSIIIKLKELNHSTEDDE